MKKNNIFFATALALLVVLFAFNIALAHEGVKVGDYEIEVGWLNEPPVIEQLNAVVVNLSDETDKEKKVDISQLIVNIAYGGQIKSLTLQPLNEDSKNQYMAPIIPAVAGEYTIQLRGKIAATDVNADAAIEEVAPADTLTFPNAAATQPTNQPAPMRLVDWVSIAALVIALAALVLSLRKSRA